MALMDRVDWRGLERLVVRQQRNRSAHAPVISLYRWWARRPHCFAGALLDAAKKQFRRDRFLVADPFSGGGTVAFEAARRGLPIYAQDLYPWQRDFWQHNLIHYKSRYEVGAAKWYTPSIGPPSQGGNYDFT